MIQLSESYRAAARITKTHAKSFYFSSFPLSPEKRMAAFAVYAFCRLADDAVDQSKNPTERDLLPFRALLGGVQGGFPFGEAFQQTCLKYEIPTGLFEDLLVGLLLDVSFQQPRSRADLDKYCYHVAGCVGLIMTHIFGLNAPRWEEAGALGRAMQITNILRDVREDARRGRVYFPEDLLARHRLSSSDVLALASPMADLKLAERIWPAVLEMAQWAGEAYAASNLGIEALSDDGSRFCVALMHQTYGGILLRLLRKGPPGLFDRQGLSFFSKLLKVPNAYGQAMGFRPSRPNQILVSGA